MTSYVSRDIRTWKLPRSLPEIIQTLLVADLLTPPHELWLVSPWVTDIPVVDNSTGSLAALSPEWDRTPISLSGVLHQLMTSGTIVTVATGTANHNDAFLEALGGDGLDLWGDRLRVHRCETLHEKGLLSSHYYLRGSFNFTHNGIWSAEEAAVLHTAPDEVAEARLAFRERWREVER